VKKADAGGAPRSALTATVSVTTPPGGARQGPRAPRGARGPCAGVRRL